MSNTPSIPHNSFKVYLISGFLNMPDGSYAARWDIKAYKNKEDARHHIELIEKFSEKNEYLSNPYDPDRPHLKKNAEEEVVYGIQEISVSEKAPTEALEIVQRQSLLSLVASYDITKESRNEK